MRLLRFTVFALMLPTAGCGRSAEPPDARRGAAQSVRAATGHLVVARVNGAPIYEHQLRVQLTLEQDPRAALEELVTQEVLAQEARKRGYASNKTVQSLHRRAMANAVLHHAFGPTFTKEDIPKEVVAKAYDYFRVLYQHGELKVVQHILARTPKGATPAQKKAARAAAERVRDEAARLARRGQLNPANFKAIIKRAKGGKPNVTLLTEEVTTRAEGQTVPAFAKACFALAEGTHSEVVETRFGFHVIYLKATKPAVNRPLASVESEIRDKLFPRQRREAFVKYMEHLERKYRVKLHPENLPTIGSGVASTASHPGGGL